MLYVVLRLYVVCWLYKGGICENVAPKNAPGMNLLFVDIETNP